MNKKLKIIISDGSFNTTPFFNCLATGLSKKQEIYILGFNEKLTTKLTNVQYIKLGSTTSKCSFIKTSLKLVWQKGSFKSILKTVKMQRKQFKKQNLQNFVAKIQPDCIHILWPSVIPWFEAILKEQKHL